MFTRAPRASLFPTYLLPSVPFRRRQTSTDSTSSADSSNTDNTSSSDAPSAASSASSAPASPPSDPFLQGHTSHLRCAKCATDICLTSQVISKGFTGRHGRAYLVSPTSPFSTSPAAASVGAATTTAAATAAGAAASPALPNTRTDPPSQRQLVTGTHTVSDVRCAFCHSMLGWKYDGAEEESQRYKVGKYILETKMVCAFSDWEQDTLENFSPAPGVATTAVRTTAAPAGTPLGAMDEEDTVEFDSQDEDECEDLFAGIWSPALALKRRQNKSFRKTVVTELDSR